MDMNQVKMHTSKIIDQMNEDNWQPDYVVGIGRGGLLPAVIVSTNLNIPMYSLDISLHRHDIDNCSNCWMPEDAISHNKRIVVIDDFDDTGSTIEWIKSDWQESVIFDNWQDIWNNTVRFATIIHNIKNVNMVQYYAITSDELEFCKIKEIFDIN